MHLITANARSACMHDIVNETDVFPEHFTKGKRIATLFGNPLEDDTQVKRYETWCEDLKNGNITVEDGFEELNSLLKDIDNLKL